MHPITFPLQFDQQDLEIANLHKGLRLLLHHQIIQLSEQQQSLKEELFNEEREHRYGDATAGLILIFQWQTAGLPAEDGRFVDEATARALNEGLTQLGAFDQRVVRGTIQLADGSPLVGAIVRAFDRDMRSLEPLGERETTTDQTGYYEITYTRAQFRSSEKQDADLVIKVVEPILGGTVPQERPLAASPTLINASAAAVIDLVISPDVIPIPSEYERFIRTIEPLLQGTSLVDLREDEEDNPAEGKFQDISFLAAETEINPEYIAFLVVAARLARRVDLYPEVFYGLFRQNLPTDLSALLAQHPEIQRRALEAAIRDNIIPARFNNELDSILQRLQQLIVEQAFEEPINPDETTLPALLSTSLPDTNLQREFLSAYVQHQGNPETFWKDLRNHPTLGNSVGTLQFTLQLGAFTNNYLPLVETIQQQQITSVQELAQFSETDWLRVIRGQGNNQGIGFPSDIPGKDDNEKSANYAKAISQVVEDAAPTAFIAYRLQQDNQSDRADLRTFMAQAVLNSNNAEKFDIRTTYLEQYLTQHPNVIEQVANPERLKVEIKELQRLSKIAPQYSQIRALQDAGFDSAHSISQMSLNTFVLQHGDALGGETEAKIVHQRASQASAIALNLLASYSPIFNNTNVAAVPSQAVDRIEGIPNWQTLFGSLDLCACEHCKSVYSPAAYFVDALKFLKERNLVDQTQSRRDATGKFTTIVYQKDGTQNRTAKHVLFDRRPDLGEIELTCENTNTPVPYVDLVNEVLENAIAPFPTFTPFPISTTLENTLNTRIVSPELRSAFTPVLSDFAVITIKNKGKWWTIDEPAYTYTVRKESDQLRVVARSLQTSSTPQELSANPQYINAEAYEQIRTAVYPWSLPFDLWWEESRIYLEHLGVSRQQLMETYFRGDRTILLNNPAIAAEYLGIPPFEWQIITNGRTIQLATTTNLNSLSGLQPVDGVTPALDDWVLVKDQTDGLNQGIYIVKNDAWLRIKHEFNSLTLVTIQKGTANQGKVWLMAVDNTGAVTVEPQPSWSFWGLAENGNTIPDPTKEEPKRTKQAGWLEVLQNVQRFLERANLTYTELLDLLQTNFANPDRTIQIQAIPVDPITEEPVPLDCCDPEKLLLTNLSEAKLNQMYRFIRLWRRLGWTIPELDKAITLLKPSGLVSAFVIRLSHIQRLHDEFHIPILTLINWWGAIDAAQYVNYQSTDLSPIPSLYSQLFRNKSVTNPLNPTFTEDPARLSGKLSDSATVVTITAAFGITVEDFSLLFNDANVIPKASSTSSNPDDKLNLANLSRLYRHVTLAKALGLSIRDYLTVRQLIGTDPFASTTDTILFVERIDKIRRSGFTIAELAYLLNHSYTEALGVAPTQEAIALMLADIRTELQKIAAENTFTDVTSDPTGELSQKKLAVILNAPDLERAIALIGGSWKDDTAKAFIDQHFAKFLNQDEAKAQLIDSTTFTNLEERYLYVLKPLLAYLRRTLSESLVKQKLTEALKLEANIVDRLLTQYIKSSVDSPRGAIAEFLDPAFTGSTANILPTTSVFKTFTLLQKIAVILTKLRTTQNQLIWLFTYAPEVGWLDLKTLPTTQTVSPATQFAAWERLVDLMQLRDILPLGEALLNEIFSFSRNVSGDSSIAYNSLLQTLSRKTQWSLEDLTFLSKIGFNFEFPNAFKDEQALTRLVNCFTLQKRLGNSARQGYFWSTPSVTEDTARSIKQTAKAKYEESQWLTLAKPLRDILREKQRSALVTYLVAHPDPRKQQHWKDTNGLYEHFLIDVEMSPCQMTSRIKQAIGSVQLFVQRCLMNLERQVLASAEIDEKWRQWKWMKNYRVWEANRKVFLYPENWIEPELRDDKSPFFKDLENELLQNDLTTDTAETAFLHYLEKLDAVARLEVVGMYHQEEISVDGLPAVDILHIFGRTNNTPHVYYYRRCIDKTRWAAWEKVDVDIEGDHLMPVLWNRRLYLFWAILTEKQNEQPIVMPEQGKPMQSAGKYWEIQLAWSEYKSRKWTAKKITKKVPDPMGPNYMPPKYTYSLKLLKLQPELIIGLFGSRRQGGNPDFGNINLCVAEFKFSSCNSEPFYSGFTSPSYKTIAPEGTYFENGTFAQVTIQGRTKVLQLQSGNLAGITNDEDRMLQKRVTIPTLGSTPEKFNLLTSQQELHFVSQRPFFFQDSTKTFFIIPENNWVDLSSEKFDLRIIEAVSKKYFSKAQQPALVTTKDILKQLTYGSSLPVEARFDSVAANDAIARSAASIQSISRNDVLAGSSTTQPVISNKSFLDVVNVGSLLNPSSDLGKNISKLKSEKRYFFQAFYHPYVCTFIREMNRNGIDGLLQRITQTDPLRLAGTSTPFNFRTTYNPQSVVKAPYPVEEVDFSSNGSYSQYNWELFFHVPLIIADRLSKNQRFEEAQKWFHYIFNPTDTSSYSSPQKYWQNGYFFKASSLDYQREQIQNLLRQITEGNSELAKQVDEWRAHPFQPHLIARMRTTAYQKTVVMKYIDNLIAWGDQLFRRDTIESINEATQLYILAAEILGRRPQTIPPRAVPQVQTYNTLEPKLDSFSNALVGIELLVPVSTEAGAPTTQPPLNLQMLYFCIPKNDKLLGYWDTVSDRLFKIRHCMNIEGVTRQLPLFEPPIDPALLVRATAAGIDISSALNDINAALPHYRFNVMMQKATELCAELKSLGAALLSALEKRDAEALALLRSQHEIKVLEAVRQVREQQFEESKRTLESLGKSKDIVIVRRDFYANIPFMIVGEKSHLSLASQSINLQETKAGMDLVANTLFFVPDVKVGPPTTIGATFGGQFIANAMRAYSTYFGELAGILGARGSIASTLSSYQRRFDDWKLQEKLANKELEQLDKQIAAAEIRVAIAQQELKNHDLQIENAKAVDAYMRDKFTNQQLYDWMVGQISNIYFQSYQLAYDVAKRAERAYRFELGLQDSNFIQFGYWDSLKKGLLTGERLHYDLKRMEVAYLDQHKREYEITKHISLTALDPVALIQLKQTGECFISIPEVLFDLDCPGHYMRRIKSVSLTIPCVTGPYTSVNCTLTLVKSSIRQATSLIGEKYIRQEGNDTRFMDTTGAIQSVVTSSAQNDSGLFEPNLRDERYLPFEGSGAVSDWQLKLPNAFPQFDYGTISDVVLHLRYTAREGSDSLKRAAIKEIQTALETIASTDGTVLVRSFNTRHEFPTEWHHFLHSTEGDQTLTISFSKDRFPFLFQSKEITINKIRWFVKVQNVHFSNYKSKLKSSYTRDEELIEENGLLVAEAEVSIKPSSETKWSLPMWVQETSDSPHQRVSPEAIEDIILICYYSVSAKFN